MRSLRWLGLVLTIAVGPGTLAAVGQAHWTVTKTFHIGGDGGWDYVTVDAPRHRFFVTRSTHTQAIDEQTGKVLADIPGQSRSHGVALAPQLGRGFITDGGGGGAIVVFDTNTYKVLGRIPAVPDADGTIYDPGTKTVLVTAGDSNALLAFSPDIDPQSGKIQPIGLPGSPEFLAADGAGRVYVNIPDKNEVAVVDLHTRKVVAIWPVAPGGEPVGMAIDPAHHRLFIGCRKPQKLVVMSTVDGNVEAALPIGAGNDAVRFSDGQAFASCGDGSLTVIGEKAGHWIVEQSLKTAQGARTMGLDTTAHRIFLPTGQFEPASGGGRPKMKPNTFAIVVADGQ